MAGLKGNRLSEIWWSNIKGKLEHRCDMQSWKNENGKLCCHHENETDDEFSSRNCHVPWASLEHMKNPSGVMSAIEIRSSSSGASIGDIVGGKRHQKGFGVR